MVDHLTVSRAAAGLGVGWHTANTAILTEGKRLLIDDPVIDALDSGVPAALVELRKLGRTLKQRAADVLAFFDLPGMSSGPSSGPTEAINGRLEHLRGTALGFRP